MGLVLSEIPGGALLFICFLNGVLAVVHSSKQIFADDIEIFRVVNKPNQAHLWHNDSMEDCSIIAERLSWKTEKVMHLGNWNKDYIIACRKLKLQTTEMERDLCLYDDSTLTVNTYYEKKINMANRLLGLIRRWHLNINLNNKIMKTLCIFLMIPHLEYNTFWCLVFRKDNELM